MIGGASNGKHLHAVIAGNFGKVIPKPQLAIGRNELLALLGGEDDVEEGANVAVWHVPPLKGFPEISQAFDTQCFRTGLFGLHSRRTDIAFSRTNELRRSLDSRGRIVGLHSDTRPQPPW